MHHFQAYSDHEILISRTSKSLMLKVGIKNEEYDATKLSTRRRLHYEDVYSDESDDDKYESTGKDDAQMETDEEPLSNTDRNVQHPNPGDFVLVKLLSNKMKEFRYVAVCQSKVNEDIVVTFLRKYGEDTTLFKIDENDERLVATKDIIRVLEQPKIKTVGSFINYCFDGLELKKSVKFRSYDLSRAFDTVNQGCPTYGPRAESGPRSSRFHVERAVFIWWSMSVERKSTRKARHSARCGDVTPTQLKVTTRHVICMS
ncbi:hypothetical protein J6590_075329 [Homalodisca vitripennis]|nr:hypothetical protein J6590_075329 [Homalodisca vitripennis]